MIICDINHKIIVELISMLNLYDHSRFKNCILLTHFFDCSSNYNFEISTLVTIFYNISRF